MSTTVRLSVIRRPVEWETVHGTVALTVGRTTEGFVTSQVEFDGDVFQFGPDDLGVMTSTVLDAWVRKHNAELGDGEADR